MNQVSNFLIWFFCSFCEGSPWRRHHWASWPFPLPSIQRLWPRIMSPRTPRVTSCRQNGSFSSFCEEIHSVLTSASSLFHLSIVIFNSFSTYWHALFRNEDSTKNEKRESLEALKALARELDAASAKADLIRKKRAHPFKHSQHLHLLTYDPVKSDDKTFVCNGKDNSFCLRPEATSDALDRYKCLSVLPQTFASNLVPSSLLLSI